MQLDEAAGIRDTLDVALEDTHTLRTSDVHVEVKSHTVEIEAVYWRGDDDE